MEAVLLSAGAMHVNGVEAVVVVGMIREGRCDKRSRPCQYAILTGNDSPSRDSRSDLQEKREVSLGAIC